ncbi:MAG: hypothetical protein RLZZ76_76 [Candidatus Parcubacteria bacterium]|jgi:ADP-ribose pyrophosphatase YjhB (NUDIX family)
MSEKIEVHFSGKIAQKAILVKGDKVLLVRDPREAEEIWEIPGGRMNKGEEPRTGLGRELMEELGVSCDIHEVIHLEQFFQKNEGSEAFVIVYRATLLDENAPFTFEDREVCEHKWVGKGEWETLKLFPEYKRALETYFNTL